jgi:hypothetical protein
MKIVNIKTHSAACIRRIYRALKKKQQERREERMSKTTAELFAKYYSNTDKKYVSTFDVITDTLDKN